MQHDKWLAWRLKHGVESRGRPTVSKPTGVVAKVVHTLFYKRKQQRAVQAALDSRARKPIQFRQHVGGALGPAGTVNERDKHELGQN